MKRAARLGLMIGLVIGLSSCAAGHVRQGDADTGFYGGVEAGRTG